MAGEMTTVEREEWPLHFAVAEAVGGSVKPFDQYQGPYVVVGDDIRLGSTPYAYAPMHLGVKRLWVTIDEAGFAVVYREDINESLCVPCVTEAVMDAARILMEWS
jgi:hypothetical protein